VSQLPSPVTTFGIEVLHDMSQAWNLIQGDLDDLYDWLEFLLSIRKTYEVACKEIQEEGTFQSTADDGSVDESLDFLISRNRIWKRWISNYNERTKIRISLFSHLASQNDNRTRLQIAGLASVIVAEAQRDNSTLKT
jgi:hypothetical protein